jgi:hypothetical protein
MTARKQEKATPEPFAFPEPFIPTTMERVRRVRNGQVASVESTDLADVYWWDWDGPDWFDNEIVLWRPSPPRKVTIELREDDARNTSDWARGNGPVGDRVADAIDRGLAALDGDK